MESVRSLMSESINGYGDGYGYGHGNGYGGQEL
jgi:hypothetical protein